MTTLKRLTPTIEVPFLERSAQATQLGCLYTLYCNNGAIGHIFHSLSDYMDGAHLRTRMIVPNCDPILRRPNLEEVIPVWLKKLCYRFPTLPRSVAEKRFLKELDQFDAAYLWPHSSTEMYRQVKQRGKPIFTERINCYTGKAKRILDEAYQRLGAEPEHLITEDCIRGEDECMALADFIFCPSPEVKDSFQEAGIPEQKLILTSYGWSPQRFPGLLASKTEPKPASDGITVLFVGKVCVRKGSHLLLRAWEKAGIKGKLVLCGRMEPAIAKSCASLLSRPDVVYQEFNPNIHHAFADADIFAFPSLEEGSPLVTYEAMAHGLPLLVSSMGAGGIVRDDMDGMIIPPYSEDQWVEALQKLAASPELRTRFGEAARQRASEFTWEKVATRRAAAAAERLQAISEPSLAYQRA